MRDEETLASIFIRTEADKVTLSYRHQRAGSDWQPMEYAVQLDWTACTYGGARPWFLCPAESCGRRVAKLYGVVYKNISSRVSNIHAPRHRLSSPHCGTVRDRAGRSVIRSGGYGVVAFRRTMGSRGRRTPWASSREVWSRPVPPLPPLAAGAFGHLRSLMDAL